MNIRTIWGKMEVFFLCLAFASFVFNAALAMIGIQLGKPFWMFAHGLLSIAALWAFWSLLRNPYRRVMSHKHRGGSGAFDEPAADIYGFISREKSLYLMGILHRLQEEEGWTYRNLATSSTKYSSFTTMHIFASDPEKEKRKQYYASIEFRRDDKFLYPFLQYIFDIDRKTLVKLIRNQKEKRDD